jgi:hypothetical protein
MLSLLLAAITTFAANTPHLSVQAIVEPETASPNSELTITFTVTPARGIHVYAPGSEYQAIAVTLEEQPGVKARKVVYPPSETYYFEPLDESVPVYQKPFTLKQVVAVGASALKGKNTLKLSGRLEYQACDDRVCFRPNAIPFTFELKVKR